MKNILILLAIITFTGITLNLFAQKDRKLSNGFSINLVTGFPSSKYGVPKDSQVNASEELGGIWGLKIGNRWYFSPKDKYGFGLMVNWFDFSIAAQSEQFSGNTYTNAVGDVSFLQFGPVGTYAATDNIALDGYFNFRPTVFENLSIPNGDDAYGWAGVGFSYALGGAFRYKILNVGIEYVFGGVNTNYITTGSSSSSDPTNSYKLMTNSFRILLGLKL
jgi:hypothetical protein